MTRDSLAGGFHFMVFPNLGAKDGFSESATRISRVHFRGISVGEDIWRLYIDPIGKMPPLQPHRCHLNPALYNVSFPHELMHKDA